MNPEILQNRLAFLGLPSIRYFDQLGSTNDEALAWIEAGAAEGSLVVADSQTSGRGRLARKWVTKPGSSLAFSLILKPTIPERDPIALFSPLAGLALCQVLQQHYAVPARMKWPNDVLIRRQKLAGILTEANWSDDQTRGIVIGVGINIAVESLPSPDELLFPATCLEQHTNYPVDRMDLLGKVIQKIIALREIIGQAEFFAAWKSNLAFLGEEVHIESAGKAPIIGKVKNIDQNGNLLLKLKDNTIYSVTAGDVHLRPSK